MKKNQLIILGSLFLLFALIFLAIISNKKELTKETKSEQSIIFVPVREVKNEVKELQIISYGQVLPNAEIDVAFEVQGKLETAGVYLRPGTSFNKGQVLYRVNNQEAIYTLKARKAQLSNLLLGALPDVELDFPKELKKWLSFMNGVQAENTLPNLPEFITEKERMFMTSRGITSEYYNLKSSESRMAKYTYYAPFSGTVIETYAEAGAIANPGSRLARIAKTGDYEIKVPISLQQLAAYQKEGKVKFYSVSGKRVGFGKMARISDVVNQQTQSVDVYYSIVPSEGQKIYSGLFVNVAINQKALSKSIALPRLAVTDGKVNVLKNEKIVSVPITIVGDKPDSVFISGLQDGDKVLLEKMEFNQEGKTFKGITR